MEQLTDFFEANVKGEEKLVPVAAGSELRLHKFPDTHAGQYELHPAYLA